MFLLNLVLFAQDLAFQRLIFITMLGWENPYKQIDWSNNGFEEASLKVDYLCNFLAWLNNAVTKGVSLFSLFDQAWTENMLKL